MKIRKECKKAYSSIEVPQELDYVVNRTINANHLQKKNKNKVLLKSVATTLATTFALFVILLNTNEAFAKSMEDIPVINVLAKVFTVREFKEENDFELIEAKVPALRDTGNTELEERMNYQISQKIDEVINEAKTRAEEYKEAILATGGSMDDYSPIQINVDYKITYQDEKLVSFIITKSESMASAYTEQYFYNIDLENGKELNLKDVLGEQYKSIIDKSVQSQIEQRQNENNLYFTAEEGGFSGIENEYHDFYINEDKKVTVVFQKYEIAPGYMGIQNFEIPNDILV